MTTEEEAWNSVVLGKAKLNEGLLGLRSKAGLDRVRHELVQGDRSTALFVLPYLSDQEIEHLLPELVFLASFSHGSIEHVRNTIRRLPGALLKRLLPVLCEQHLQTDEEYRRFLELFASIDDELSAGLAERACASEDPEIREVGAEFQKP